MCSPLSSRSGRYTSPVSAKGKKLDWRSGEKAGVVEVIHGN